MLNSLKKKLGGYSVPLAPLVALDEHLTRRTNIHLSNGRRDYRVCLADEAYELVGRLELDAPIASLKRCLESSLRRITQDA